MGNIAQLIYTDELIDTCDITVKDVHCYYANGILVSNSGQELRLPTNLCIDYGTIVTTNYGNISLASISHLLVLDIFVEVLTPKGFVRAVSVEDTGKKRTFEVTFSDDKKVRCSLEHRFLVKRGSKFVFKQLKDMNSTDLVVDRTDNLTEEDLVKLMEAVNGHN